MHRWSVVSALVVSLLVASLLAAGAAAATTRQTQRVSVSSAGTQANAASDDYAPAVSADGRYVAFDSAASNLVPGDTNGFIDVFVRDRTLRKTFRVSVGPPGVQGNGDSEHPAISANGRYVAFASSASNLVSGDTNGASDVFVRDRKLHKTYLVSVSSAGAQGNSDSYGPSISANGRYVAFYSEAGNLTSGDTHTFSNVFVRDRKLHKTYLVSVGTAGRPGNSDSSAPSISGDGRYVAFDSAASDLVAGDTNGSDDVFVRDLKLHKTRRASVSSAGVQGNDESEEPAISADGRYVAFNSAASNLVGVTTNYGDIFVRDLRLHKTRMISVSPAGVQGDGVSGEPAISAGGRYVVFVSGADNLVSGDTNGFGDIFVRDLKLHRTRLVSVGPAAVQGNADSFDPAMSADGRYVAFDSRADNLVSGDSNAATDVFVRGPYR